MAVLLPTFPILCDDYHDTAFGVPGIQPIYSLGFKGAISQAGKAVYKLGRFVEFIIFVICNVKQWYPAKNGLMVQSRG